MERASWRFVLLLFHLLVTELGGHVDTTADVHGDCASVHGHLLPLGAHRDPEGSIDSYQGFIKPQKFFEEYVRPSRPVLFREAAKSLKAYELWDDVYLQEKYGNIMTEVETRKKEDRLQDVHIMTMGEFLLQYKKSDIYMVHDVPSEMDEDLGLPRPLLCGGFQEVLQTAVLWFSNGGTRSVLHSDDVDNINCLMDGDKDLIMIDKAFMADVEAHGFVRPQGYSQVDVDAVDFQEFPRLRNLPWWKVEMKKGDCLYIPLKWYHQVNSRGRNLAVNLWFFHLLWFNQSDCEAYEADLQHDFIPLSRYDLAGPESPEYARAEIFQPFEGLDQITVEDVRKNLGHALSSVEVNEFFLMLDVNKDFVISWEEVYSCDPEQIVSTFPQLLPGNIEGHDVSSIQQEKHTHLTDEL